MKVVLGLQFNNLTAENRSFTKLKQATAISFVWVGWYGLEWLGSRFLIKWNEKVNYQLHCWSWSVLPKIHPCQRLKSRFLSLFSQKTTGRPVESRQRAWNYISTEFIPHKGFHVADKFCIKSDFLCFQRNCVYYRKFIKLYLFFPLEKDS